MNNSELRRPKAMPLLSWDIFMDGYYNRIIESKKRSELNSVIFLAEKFNWKNNFDLIFSKNEYEALIITDKNQKIIWVNDGFTSMTGYSKKTALNNTPRFLQGEKTTIETKKRIKAKIALNKPFNDKIINHRKDKSTYKCEIKIFPLFNTETTHYIAFERPIL